MRSRRRAVGSSPKTSSPTAASAMARRISGVGCVTVVAAQVNLGHLEPPRVNGGGHQSIRRGKAFARGGAARWTGSPPPPGAFVVPGT